ncbi:MAG: ABC transporter permease [Myxococcaceae bacterium]
MIITQTLRVATRALMRNKMRSFLTTLGIIIGVGAVIAMVAIGEGAKARVEEAFASMGTDLLIIMPGSSNTGGSRGGFGSASTLTWDDMRAIQQEVPTVRYVSAALRSTGSVISEDQNWTTTIQGTNPEYFDIRNWEVTLGRRFGASDVEGGRKVVVLGATVVEKLFGANTDPVGQVVRVKNIPFEVIGVLARKGQSPMGQDYDDAVFIPQTTFQAKIQGGLQKYVTGTLFVGAQPGETVKAQEQISALLRDRHRLRSEAEDDFNIRNMTEIANAQQQGTSTLTSLLAAIAAVSLLGGGIGIMNIMLVSVTERTREIGVRMAVGAKPRNILAQFLVEALVLSLAGGIVGVLLGLGVGRWLASSNGWPILVRADVIGVAVGFSALVGVGFGLYPAHKASRLDPIQALRFE